MRRHLLIVGFFAMVAAIAGPTGSAAPVGQGGRSISGTVIDAVTRQPIRFVNVSANPNGGCCTPGVATDAEGRFQLADLPAGPLTIRARHPAYPEGVLGARRAMGLAPPLEFDPGEKLDGLQIAMWPNAGLTGTVRNGDGRAMIGVAVYAMGVRYGGDEIVLGAGRMARTDSRGVYVFNTISPDRYVFAIASPTLTGSFPIGGSQAWLTQFHPGTVSPGDATIVNIVPGERRTLDLTYKTLATVGVGGTVDAAGNRAVDLRLCADGDRTHTDLDLARVRSDADGRFVFPAVPAGRYRIQVAELPVADATPGFKSAAFTTSGAGFKVEGASWVPVAPLPDAPTRWADVGLVVGRQAVADVVVALRPGLRITGRYIFNGASPPSAVLLAATPVVTLSLTGRQFDNLPLGGIAPDGRFRTVGLPADRYALMPLGTALMSWSSASVSVNGQAVPHPIVDLRDVDADVAITLTDRLATVSGAVRDAGGRMRPDATVYLFPADRNQWPPGLFGPTGVLQMLPDRHGRYRSSMIRPGEYFVTAVMTDDPDYRRAAFLQSLVSAATRIRVEGGKPAVVDLTIK